MFRAHTQDRNYMFHYSGGALGAVRLDEYKIVIPPGPAHGGLPNVEFYNVRRDPRETRGAFYSGLYAVTPLQNLLRDHMMMVKKFPHREPGMPKGAELTPHD